MDAAIPIKVLHPALLGADKMVPILDGVFSVTTTIVINQIYTGKYVAKLISSFGCRQIIASIGCNIYLCIQSNLNSCNYCCCMQNCEYSQNCASIGCSINFFIQSVSGYCSYCLFILSFTIGPGWCLFV